MPRSSSTKRGRSAPHEQSNQATDADGKKAAPANPAPAESPVPTLGLPQAVFVSSLLLGATAVVGTWISGWRGALIPGLGFDPVAELRTIAEASPYASAVTLVAIFFAWTTLSLWAEPRGGILKAVKEAVTTAALAAPGVKGIVAGKMDSMMESMKKELLGDIKDEDRILALPKKGLPAGRVQTLINSAAAKDRSIWASGKHSGTVYHGGDDLQVVIESAMSKFALSNPLHPDCFPSLRKMDAEIVAMTLSLFSPTSTSCGTTTSGGTESILLACKAYRDRAATEKGIRRPEMIIPQTAHAAFNKGAHYFGIKLVVVPVDQKTFRVNPADVKARINSNTVMLVGSAPSFPQGTVDPIPELAALAESHGIGLHVDCCLGSFMMPLARSIGKRDVPDFDFSVPGVTSISCDTHKFGFAPKGSSVIMWKDKDWRFHQYYVSADWTGGIYATPTIAGSRPGANLAATWAVMMHVGRDGYEAAARKIFKAADIVTEGVRSVPELEQYGSTDHSVVAFGARRDGGETLDVYKVVNSMTARGWQLNSLQNPPSVHLCVTYANADMADAFVDDLKACVKEVKANPDKYKGGAVAMYGSSAMAPQGLLHDVAGVYMDTVYTA